MKKTFTILLLAIMLSFIVSCDSNSTSKKEQKVFDGYCVQCGKGFYKENAWAGKVDHLIGKSENGSYCSEYCANLSISPN